MLTNQEKLNDKRQKFRKSIRRDHIQEILQMKRQQSIEEANRIELRSLLVGSCHSFSNQYELIKAVSLDDIQKLQSEVESQMIQNIPVRNINDLYKMSLITLKKRQVCHKYLLQLLQFLADKKASELEEQYIKYCLSYFSACLPILREGYQKQLKMLINTIIGWWNDDDFEFKGQTIDTIILGVLEMQKKQLNRSLVPMVSERLEKTINLPILQCIYRILLSENPEEFITQLVNNNQILKILEALEDYHKAVLNIMSELCSYKIALKQMIRMLHKFDWLRYVCHYVSTVKCVTDILIDLLEEAGQQFANNDHLTSKGFLSELVEIKENQKYVVYLYLVSYSDKKADLLENYNIICQVLREMPWNQQNLQIIQHFFRFLYNCRNCEDVPISKALLEQITFRVESSQVQCELADDLQCLKRELDDI